MTYCAALRLKDGILAIADRRISSSAGLTEAKKIYTIQVEGESFFLMTSGLRSVRDKVIKYLEEKLEVSNGSYNRMYKMANLLGDIIKKVAKEDRDLLVKNGYDFNIHCIIGGQCLEDQKCELFVVFPEGNWIDVPEETPFATIGSSGYGKALLKNVVKYETDLATGFKTVLLAYENTRQNAADVGYPLDAMLYKQGSFKIVNHTYHEKDLEPLMEQWKVNLKEGISSLPIDFATPILG